jgi:hypothetical protein
MPFIRCKSCNRLSIESQIAHGLCAQCLLDLVPTDEFLHSVVDLAEVAINKSDPVECSKYWVAGASRELINRLHKAGLETEKAKRYMSRPERIACNTIDYLNARLCLLRRRLVRRD